MVKQLMKWLVVEILAATPAMAHAEPNGGPRKTWGSSLAQMFSGPSCSDASRDAWRKASRTCSIRGGISSYQYANCECSRLGSICQIDIYYYCEAD